MSIFERLSRRFSRSPARQPAGLPPTGFPLDQFLRDELDRHLDPWPHVVDLLAEKAAAQGVRLSQRDRRRFEEALRVARGAATLQLQSWKWWERKHAMELGLTDAESEAIGANLDRILDRLPEAIPEFIEATAPSLLDADLLELMHSKAATWEPFSRSR